MTSVLTNRLLDQVLGTAGHNPTPQQLTDAATRVVGNLPDVGTRYARTTIETLLGNQHPLYNTLLAMAAAEPVTLYAPQALVGALVAAAAERVGGRVAA